MKLSQKEEKEKARAWFKETFGFEEREFGETRGSFELEGDGTVLVSKANGAKFEIGPFEWPSLAELRERLGEAPEPAAGSPAGGLSCRQVVGEAAALHQDARSAGGVFQVASQFNCLEMLFPEIRPEDGVTRYAEDKTQGPACALVCPGATIFRNYFVNGAGQAKGRQLDMLKDISVLLENGWQGYWRMENGYCLPGGPSGCLRLRRDSGPALAALGERLRKGGSDLLERIRANLHVGVHWETAVRDSEHKVCQIFCSAVPMTFAKSRERRDLAPFARVVLEAAYEATLACAALLAQKRQARVLVCLTALGGGSFGNDEFWILGALERALALYRNHPLDVQLVYYKKLPTGPLKDLSVPKPDERPWEAPKRLFEQYLLEAKCVPKYDRHPEASDVLRNYPHATASRQSLKDVLISAVENLNPKALHAVAAFFAGLVALRKAVREDVRGVLDEVSRDEDLRLDNPGLEKQMEEVRGELDRREREPDSDSDSPAACCGDGCALRRRPPARPAHLPRELARLT